jgi:ATP-dependent DNA ligase
MAQRDGKRVRCFTRNGHDWADRFPAIVEAALRIRTATSFLIDGEAVILGEDGSSNFNALRTKRQGEAVLVAFDLLEDDDSNLREQTVIERKARLKKLLGSAEGGRPSSTSTI